MKHENLRRHIHDDVLWENVLRRFKYAAVQLDHSKEVKARARSGYYQAAAMYLASIVEAHLHVLLSKAQKEGKCLPCMGRHQDYTQLPKKFFGDDIYVCRKKREPMKIMKNTDLKDVIDCCNEMQLISIKLAKKCHRVRNIRNQIHIMGRQKRELSHTQENIDHIGAVIDALASLLQK